MGEVQEEAVTPIVHKKLFCLCGGYVHVVDAPENMAIFLTLWERRHEGLGHGLCRPSEAKPSQRLRRQAMGTKDDFYQAMNDLRP